jgi:hypothetical protein
VARGGPPVGYGPGVVEIGDALIDPEVWVVVAIATLSMPLVFLTLLVVAALRRRATGTVRPAMAATLAATGGLTLGTLASVSGGDLVVLVPMLVASAVVLNGLWRRRRRSQAGWLLTGIALPSAILGSYVVAALLQGKPVDPVAMVPWFAVSTVGLAAGLVMIRRGDPPLPAPDIRAPAGQPGSREFGNIAEAIRSPARLGPIAVPELSMLIAVVVIVLVAPLLIPHELPRLAQSLILGVVVSIIGTEVYVRAWPSVSRRAFEAFSWLGEWEIAGVRALTGSGPPTSRAKAAAWLERRPDRPEERAIRVEVSLFAGRIDDARAVLSTLSAKTPSERFELVALGDLVDWHAGGDGDLPAMEAAAAEILPADGDERLRAEVTVAAAKVRRRMAEGGATPEAVVEPLLVVRQALGHRADGQIGRALRRRILPLLLGGTALFAIASELLGMTGTSLP